MLSTVIDITSIVAEGSSNGACALPSSLRPGSFSVIVSRILDLKPESRPVDTRETARRTGEKQAKLYLFLILFSSAPFFFSLSFWIGSTDAAGEMSAVSPAHRWSVRRLQTVTFVLI
jgi:hypothetical protein